MISNILGITIMAAAISTLVFAAITVYRFAKKRKAGWVKYALFTSTAIGIASFIALGSTYSPPVEPERLAMQQDDESAAIEKVVDAAEEPSGQTDKETSDIQEDTSQSSTLPSAPQKPDAEKPESSNAPLEPEQAAEPDYDAMLEELEGGIEASASAAVKGKFDTSIKPTVDFTPYTGFLLIKAQASDNLTASLIRKGILADIRDTLEAIPLDAIGFSIPAGDETLQIYALERIGFNISFPKTDSYGRVQSVIILKAEYTREELQKVDWANKVTVDFEELADTFWYSEE